MASMKHKTIRARILAALLPAVCAVGFALPASADLPPVLANAVLTTTKAGSYHYQLTETIGTTSMNSSGDVQSLSPMKMRATTNMGGPAGTMEMIIVAPNSYMKTGGAAWKKFPGDPSDYAKMDAATMLAKDKGQYEVTDLGMKLKDGQMLHAYKAVNKTRNTMETVYLDSAGRIARMEMPAMMMQFSNYGEAVDIKAPI